MIQAEIDTFLSSFSDNLLLEIAVSPSTLGELEVTLLKMLMRTRKMVTRSVIRPGTISGGMRKLTQDTVKIVKVKMKLIPYLPRTKSPEGR